MDLWQVELVPLDQPNRAPVLAAWLYSRSGPSVLAAEMAVVVVEWEGGGGGDCVLGPVYIIILCRRFN